MKNAPPKYVESVLSRLRRAGFEAYPVGGCVRDMLLGLRPKDWDVCSSAMPEELMRVFAHSRPTGLKHGTVTVIISGSSVEVTTFRTEGSYTDHRHPDRVEFVRDLMQDLSRRDFTINAMALAPDGGIIDLFGGQEDINAHLIRAVGEPEKRFEEDALRMLRALRFSARLGFELEENTAKAIKKLAPLVAGLAPERIREETEKILLSPAPETIGTAAALGLLEPYIPAHRLDLADLGTLKLLPRDSAVRFAALCVLCGESSEKLLGALRLDNASIRLAADVEKLMGEAAPAADADFKRIVSRCGERSAAAYTEIYDALNGAKLTKRLKAVLQRGECYTVAGLKISGRELMALGYSGREIGAALNDLLEKVICDPSLNNPAALIRLADAGRKKYGQL